MACHRYLVAYDIREDRRLRTREAVLMRSDMETRMKPSEDSVMIIDLGRAGDSSRFLFLGHHEKLPASSATIV
jgi:hypothetical protein